MHGRLSATKNRIFKTLLASLSVAAASAQPHAYVSNLAGNNVSVVDTNSHTNVATVSVPGSPTGLAVTPDGTLVYVACQGNGTVAVISTASNSVVASIPVGNTPVQLAISPNGAQAYVVVRGQNQVAVIDTASKTVLSTISVGNRPVGVAFSPDGSRAYVPNLYGGTVSLISTATRSVINTFPAASGPSGVAVLPNGQVYVSNQYAGTVTVHDSSGNLLTTIGGFVGPSWIAASPNGSRAFVTNGNSGSVGVIDTGSNTLIATIATGSLPTSVAVSADGASAYVTNEYSFTLSQISVASNTLVNTQSSVGVYPVAVALPPAGGPPPPPPCTFTLSQNSASFSSAGGAGSVTVTPSASCGPWTATSNVGWAQITSGASGSGTGTVNYSVSSNGSSVPLSGTLTVAGQTFTINVAGVPCSYSLSSSSNSFGAAGGSGSVNVTAPSGCGWNAVSNVGWSQITAGSSGSGSGTVSYSVNSNASSIALNGTLTIAGQTFTINVAGLACSYSLSSSSTSLGSGAGGGSVNLTAAGGCGWNATSDSPWLSITAGFSGSGNGTVSFAVTASQSTGPRTGNLTIGGQNFAVTQAGVAFTPIRVHCGGPQVTDGNGNVWAAGGEQNYNITTASISGTTTPSLYQSEAWSTGTLQYQYAVPNGSFTVKLKFAEFYVTQNGQRTFNIVVNGTTFYSSYDIRATAGPMAAVDVSIPVVVNNGQITIQLVPVTGRAKLNALEIF